MAQAELPTCIRHARIGDLNFILGTFIESTRRMRPWSHCEPEWLCKAQRSVMRELLAVSTVMLSVNQSDDDHLFGYIVGDPTRRAMHYLYVKELFRRQGIGTSLMHAMFGEIGKPAEPVKYTIKTAASHNYHDKWGLVFDPHELSVLK